MRYKALNDDLILFNVGGEIAYNPTTKLPYRFGRQGVLIVGDNTTKSTGYYINDNAHGTITGGDVNELDQIYSTDLAGITTSQIEMAGLGTLNGVRTGGVSCSFITGLRGKFFEAPPVAAGTSITDCAGSKFIVLDGEVTYNSVKYKRGQKFTAATGVTATTATVGQAVGHFALTLPTQLTQGCEAFYAQEFEIKDLMVGDESNSYWNWDDTGAEARATNTTTDPDYFNWTR
jgi:hypothetical protein